MPAGLEIYNSDNKLMVSTELIGYFCRKSGTGTTQTAPDMGNTSPAKAVVPISGLGYSYPIVAIRIPGYTVSFARAYTVGGDRHFTTDAPVGTSFTYYIFDYAPALPAASSGLEVYNSSGQRTFSSFYHPLQVLNILTGGSVTYTGKSLATGLTTIGGFRVAGDYDYYSGGFPVPEGDPYDETGYRNDADLYGGMVSNSNQTITYGSVSFDDVYFGPGPGDIYKPPDFDNPCPVLVVDVSTIPLNTTFF